MSNHFFLVYIFTAVHIWVKFIVTSLLSREIEMLLKYDFMLVALNILVLWSALNIRMACFDIVCKFTSKGELNIVLFIVSRADSVNVGLLNNIATIN